MAVSLPVNIKTNSTKMVHYISYRKLVECLITDVGLDDEEPMVLYTASFNDLQAQIKALHSRHFPVSFKIEVKHISWLSDYVMNHYPNMMLLFLRDGSWTQFYRTDPVNEFKIFSRRAIKKSFPLTQVKQEHSYVKREEEPPQFEIDIKDEPIASTSREIKQEQKDEFPELLDYLKDKVFSTPGVSLSAISKTPLGKPAHELLREYKYVCRIDDLNTSAPGYTGLASLLTYFAIKSKVSKLTPKQRLEFEQHLRNESSKPVEQMSTSEKTIDKGAQGVEDIKLDKHGNVALTTQREDSKPKPPIKRSLGFLPNSSAKERQTLEQLTDRWVEAANFKWGTGDETGKDVCILKLPFDALRVNQNSPNIAPFNIHEYARFDMKVRVQVNSNKFQCGQLQCSWFYNASVNDRFVLYDNIYCASQRIHGLVSAGSSNDVVIEIPYWALTSAISLKAPESYTNFASILDLGRLSIKVLNPLTAASGVSTEADVTVWVTFLNIEFRGMKSSALDMPYPKEQMDTIETVIGVAKSVTNTIDTIYTQLTGKDNTDNPPVSAVPLVVQPVAAHSFCVTKGQPNITEILRAEPLNQTPSVPGSDNAMTELKSLMNIWCLFHQGKWESGDEREKVLFQEYAEPYSLSRRTKDTASNVQLYTPTILSFIQNFFGYFRGEIELRFDFIANDFYSGRVGMFTVPGSSNNVKYKDARQSAGAVFDLQEGHQFIYKIPFFSNTPFIRARDNASGNDWSFIPSSVFMYVLNTLKCSDNIPKKIEFNVYVRGTPSYEVALLKTPNTATFFNSSVKLPANEYATINSSWAAAFTSSSRWLPGTGNMSLFYNETTDYFTQFDNLKFRKVYSVPTDMELEKDKKYRMVWFPFYKSDEEKQYRVTHLVRMLEYPNYPVVVCFDNQEAAFKYAKTGDRSGALTKYKQGQWVRYKDVTKSERDQLIKTWPTSLDGWNGMTASDLILVQFPEQSEGLLDSSDFEVVEQGDNSETVSDDRMKSEMPSTELAQATRPTGFGKIVFGEQETSIIGMCKRYQYLGCQVLKTQAKVNCLTNMTPSLIISSHPVKRFSIKSASDRDNETREGFISTLASLYAGYRGSMRYRLVISDLEKTTTASVVVIHKFNNSFNPQNDSVHIPPEAPVSFANLLDTSYATKLQCTDVNPVVEFEVPFYNTSEYNSIYPPPISNARLISDFMDSGEIWVYISTVQQIKVAVDVFYSVGDDMEFSCFQGVPQQITLYPVGQSDPTETVVDTKEPDEQLFSGVKEFLSNAAAIPKNINTSSVKLGDAAENISRTIEETSSIWSRVKESVTSSFSSLISNISNVNSIFSLITALSSVGGIMCSALIQLMYVLISPDLLTISIACASIACLIVGVSNSASSLFRKLVSSLAQMVDKYCNPTPVQQSKETDQDTSSMISILWSVVMGSLSTVAKVKKIPKPGICDVAGSLFSSSSELFRAHNFGLKFFQDFIACLRRMYQYVNKWLARDYPVFNIITDEELKMWMIESLAILEQFTVATHAATPEWSAKLYSLQAQGAVITASARASLAALPTHVFSSMTSIQRDLSQKVELLKQTNNYAPFRREPFVIWLYSDEGGSGKSVFANALPSILGKKFKVAPDYFSLTAGQKYFDGLTTEKFVILDDFLATQTNDSGDLLAQFLQMVGTGRLQLPRAALEKKLTYDDFEFVIITSNYANFQSENAAKCKSAFERRRHLIFEFTGTVKENNVKYFHVTNTSMTSKTKKEINKEEMINIIETTAEKFRKEKDILYKKQLDQYFEVLNSIRETQTVDEYVEDFKSKIMSRENLFESFDWIETWFKSLFKTKKDDIESKVEKVVDETSAAVSNPVTMQMRLEEIEELGELAESPPIDLSILTKELSDQQKKDEEAKFRSPLPHGMCPLEVLRSLEKDVPSNVESIFLPHPYAPAIHQDDFKVNFDVIDKTIFSNIDGTDDCMCCNCAVLSNPWFYRFNMKVFREWLVLHKTMGNITDEQIKYLELVAEDGIFIEQVCGQPVSSWARCKRQAELKKTQNSPNKGCQTYETRMVRVKAFMEAAHEGIYSRSWCQLWKHLKVDKYNFEELRKATPEIMWTRVDQLENLNGWKLLVKEKDIHPIKGRIRQFLGMWPKTGEIAKVFHPFPPTSKGNLTVEPKNMLDRFRVSVGAVKVDDAQQGPIWLYPWWMALLKSIGVILSILISLAVLSQFIYGMVTLYKATHGMFPKSQMLTSGAIGTGHQSATRGVQARNLLGVKAQQSSGLTSDEIEQLNSCILVQGKPISGRLQKVLKNVCFMVAKTELDNNRTGLISHRCLGLVNSKVIICKHYLEHFKILKNERGDKVKFYLVRPKTGTKLSINHEFFLDKVVVHEFGYGDKKVGDMIVVDFQKMPSTFGDIRGQMPNVNAGYYKHCMNNVLVSGNLDSGLSLVNIRTGFSDEPIEVSSVDRKSSWMLGQRLTYDAGGQGVCGSFVWNEAAQYPLLGFHTAGIGIHVGYAELLLKEEMFPKEKGFIHAECNMDVREELFSELIPNFDPVGTISNSMKPHIPRSTRIIPSLAHGIFPTLTEPAPLAKTDERLKVAVDPLIEGLKKRTMTMIPFNPQDLSTARHHLLAKFYTVTPSIELRKYSVKESIEGIKGHPRSEPIDMSTSEGYPWVKLRPSGQSNKKWLFDLSEYPDGTLQVNSIDDLLDSVLKMKSGLRRKRIIPLTYYTAMLKDARILKSKVSEPGKTRVFEMSPVDLTIAQRQFQLPFILTYMDNNLAMENTIGINVNGKEWNDLAYSLLDHSPHILAGDYSSYGPRIEANVLHEALDLIKSWTCYYGWNVDLDKYPAYDHDDTIEFETLNEEIQSSPLVCNNLVLRPAAGMASGNAATVIINSIVNSLYIRCAFLELAREFSPDKADLYFFDKYVRMYSNGDDVIISVKEEILDWFNNHTLGRCFESHDLKFTNSKKDGSNPKFESLDQVTYLKCYFKPHPTRCGFFLAALDKASIEDCCQWVWRTDIDIMAATIENCEQTVRLAYGHGPQYFSLVKTRIERFFLSHALNTPLPSWGYLDYRVWDTDEVIVNWR